MMMQQRQCVEYRVPTLPPSYHVTKYVVCARGRPRHECLNPPSTVRAPESPCTDRGEGDPWLYRKLVSWDVIEAKTPNETLCYNSLDHYQCRCSQGPGAVPRGTSLQGRECLALFSSLCSRRTYSSTGARARNHP